MKNHYAEWVKSIANLRAAVESTGQLFGTNLQAAGV